MRKYINIVEGRGITDAWFKSDSFKAVKLAKPERYRIADEPGTIEKLAKITDHDGSVDTSWGEKLNYMKDEDVIVRHGTTTMAWSN